MSNAGRPSEYSEEIAKAAWEYVDEYETKHGHAIPSIEGLAVVLKRARSTLYEWAKDPDKEFSDILEAINDKQPLILINKGLRGDFNSAITKLALGKHGYSDKATVEQHNYNHESALDELK